MDRAPRDVLLLIFPRLDGQSLLRASTVCKHWNSICKDKEWISLLKDYPPLKSDRYKFNSKASEYAFRSNIESNFRNGRAIVKLMISNFETTKYDRPQTYYYCSHNEYMATAVKIEDTLYSGSYGPGPGSYDIDFCQERFLNKTLMSCKHINFTLLGNDYLVTEMGELKKKKMGEEETDEKSTRNMTLVINSNPAHRSTSTLFVKQNYVPVFVNLDTMQEGISYCETRLNVTEKICNVKMPEMGDFFYYSPFLFTRIFNYNYQTFETSSVLHVYNLETGQNTLNYSCQNKIYAYSANDRWLVIAEPDDCVNVPNYFTLRVLSLHNDSVRNITMKEKKKYCYGLSVNSLYVDNFKIIALVHYELLRIWDVNTGEFLCEIGFNFFPSSISVVDGKVLLNSTLAVAVVHFDKINMDDKVGILIATPQGSSYALSQEQVSPGHIYDFALDFYKVKKLTFLQVRYFYRSSQHRVFILICTQQRKLAENPLMRDRKVDKVWSKIAFLPQPHTSQKVLGAVDTKEVGDKLIETIVEPENVRGPVILFSEKKTKLGDWKMVTLTKEMFESINNMTK